MHFLFLSTRGCSTPATTCVFFVLRNGPFSPLQLMASLFSRRLSFTSTADWSRLKSREKQLSHKFLCETLPRALQRHLIGWCWYMSSVRHQWDQQREGEQENWQGNGRRPATVLSVFLWMFYASLLDILYIKMEQIIVYNFTSKSFTMHNFFN